MIGKYMDRQVNAIKEGVIAVATLTGIGFIIYFGIKEHKAIAKALGIGESKTGSGGSNKAISGSKPVDRLGHTGSSSDGYNVNFSDDDDIIDVEEFSDETDGSTSESKDSSISKDI